MTAIELKSGAAATLMPTADVGERSGMVLHQNHDALLTSGGGGSRLSASDQAGLGLLLFASLACMVAGACLAVAARRQLSTAIWTAVFLLGCLGLGCVVIAMTGADADAARRRPSVLKPIRDPALPG